MVHPNRCTYRVAMRRTENRDDFPVAGFCAADAQWTRIRVGSDPIIPLGHCLPQPLF